MSNILLNCQQIVGQCVHCTLLENLTDNAISLLYVTKFTTISLYLTKLYVTYSTYQNFSNSVYRRQYILTSWITLRVLM